MELLNSFPYWLFIVVAIIPIVIFRITFLIIEIVGAWLMFEKAGEPSRAAIIPIYNYLIGIKIAGKPWWFIFIPILGYGNSVYSGDKSQFGA